MRSVWMLGIQIVCLWRFVVKIVIMELLIEVWNGGRLKMEVQGRSRFTCRGIFLDFRRDFKLRRNAGKEIYRKNSRKPTKVLLTILKASNTIHTSVSLPRCLRKLINPEPHITTHSNPSKSIWPTLDLF